MYFDRGTIRTKLQTQIQANGHIIGVAAGAGITAKYAVKGGADFILALNSGRFRQMGLRLAGRAASLFEQQRSGDGIRNEGDYPYRQRRSRYLWAVRDGSDH